MSREPNADNQFHADHVGLLLASLERLTGRRLVAADLPATEAARMVWEAPFALVSHGVETDPVFNYGNQTALRLFGMDWQAFTRLPSRFSAEAVNREERARLLARVGRDGYIDDYSGVRIAASGKRFRIEQAVVWNVVDAAACYHGQAAWFEHWTMA